MIENDRREGADVVAAVRTWVAGTSQLLGDLQALLEGAQFNGTPPDSAARELLPRVRQCRAQVPCGDAIRVWVNAQSAKNG